MHAFLVVAAVTGTFFTVGLLVGALVVIALPALRVRRSGRSQRRRPDGGRARQTIQPNDGDGAPAGHAGREYAEHGDRPRWPGDAGNRPFGH
jgi:hypothetical protein